MSDFGQTKRPVGRKDYKCVWCAETIPNGEKHIHFSGKWQDEFQNWRMHNECNDAADKDGACQDGFEPYANERPSK